MRILVADDDPISLRLLGHALQTLGHEVTTAGSGDEAWDAYTAAPYPVVVSDWMMPGVDGLELSRRIRASATDVYSFIILLSARSERADRLRALEAGVDDFLSKPLDHAELAARLAIAERILVWESRLRAANNELLNTSRLLATQAEELERMRAEAERLATYDTMTEVLNRRAWFEQARTGTDAVALVDVDHFKRINDRLGHPVGDVVLATIARRLRTIMRPVGTVGRVGGEEFAVAFAGTFQTAIDLCGEALEEIREPVELPEHGIIDITISIGLAPWQPDADDEGALARTYEAADRALYVAKSRGRDQLAIYEEATAAA